jgi:hypothetical protein
MAHTSSHLHVKPFQVAVTSDPKLPVRKWHHRGTLWAVSSLDAAYHTAHKLGYIGDAKDHPPVDAESVVYRFGDHYMRVHI